jgi:hypothetical protein
VVRDAFWTAVRKISAESPAVRDLDAVERDAISTAIG